MAITYHSGRRIQGLAGTPSDVTEDSSTRNESQTTYSSDGSTITHYGGEHFTATKWRNLELKTLVVYGSKYNSGGSGDYKLKVFGSDHSTQIGSTITGTPSVSSMPLNSAGTSNTTVTFDLTGITSPNTEWFIGVGAISSGGSPAYVWFNNAAAGDGSNYWKNYNGYTDVTGDSLGFHLTYVGTSGGDIKPLNTPVAKATGGTITTNGTKNVHTFTSGGTFTPVSAFNVEYLVVAGGGSGAVNNGGGGAGGYRTATGLGVTSQAYTITVGSGGTGSGYTGNRGNSGGNSVFSTITSTGGGGGGCEASGQIIGGNGGSGGGGGHTSGSAGGISSPVTSPVQGYAGGSSGNTQVGGGGGGSSVVGSNGSGSTAGNGGNGTANSITGSSVTYAAGGGGGDVSSGSTGGSNGIGGDGSGQNGTGTAGDTNTGSGGGGSTGGSGNSGNGGSGIVIISYEGNISNVESGSRFEETNTRKIYYKDDISWKELESAEATNYRSASWFEQLSGDSP